MVQVSGWTASWDQVGLQLPKNVGLGSNWRQVLQWWARLMMALHLRQRVQGTLVISTLTC